MVLSVFRYTIARWSCGYRKTKFKFHNIFISENTLAYISKNKYFNFLFIYIRLVYNQLQGYIIQKWIEWIISIGFGVS